MRIESDAGRERPRDETKDKTRLRPALLTTQRKRKRQASATVWHLEACTRSVAKQTALRQAQARLRGGPDRNETKRSETNRRDVSARRDN